MFSFDDEPLPTAEELKEAILQAEEEHVQAVSSLDLSYDVLMPSANFKVCLLVCCVHRDAHMECVRMSTS